MRQGLADLRVVLFEPEIPPNTGNVARLCAAMDVELNLVEPLGFSLSDRYLKRAGLDYWPHVRMRVWPDWLSFATRAESAETERWVMSSAREDHQSCPLQHFSFRRTDCLIFGPETRGLPQRILDASSWHVRIPMRSMAAGGARSLNLSTAVGIVLYAALADTDSLERWS